MTDRIAYYKQKYGEDFVASDRTSTPPQGSQPKQGPRPKSAPRPKRSGGGSQSHDEKRQGGDQIRSTPAEATTGKSTEKEAKKGVLSRLTGLFKRDS